MVKDSKLATKLKWGIVRKVFPDEEGLVRDVLVRYAILKPNDKPYVAPYTRKGPFTEKIMSTQSLAMFYSKQEQMLSLIHI